MVPDVIPLLSLSIANILLYQLYFPIESLYVSFLKLVFGPLVVSLFFFHSVLTVYVSSFIILNMLNISFILSYYLRFLICGFSHFFYL